MGGGIGGGGPMGGGGGAQQNSNLPFMGAMNNPGMGYVVIAGLITIYQPPKKSEKKEQPQTDPLQPETNYPGDAKSKKTKTNGTVPSVPGKQSPNVKSTPQPNANPSKTSLKKKTLPKKSAPAVKSKTSPTSGKKPPVGKQPPKAKAAPVLAALLLSGCSAHADGPQTLASVPAAAPAAG